MSDEPPPLEDCTEQLQQLKLRKQQQQQQHQAAIASAAAAEPVDSSSIRVSSSYSSSSSNSSAIASMLRPQDSGIKLVSATAAPKPAASQTVAAAPSNSQSSSSSTSKSSSSSSSSGGSFAGLKGGFFNRPAPSKKPASNTTTAAPSSSTPSSASSSSDDSIPFVKPSASGPAKSPLEFPSVQASLNQGSSAAMGLDLSKNPEFLSKLQSNPKLMEKLLNPKMAQAVSDFTRNPTEALKLYGNNPEIGSFFMEFMQLMGNHLTEHGDQMEQEKRKIQEQQERERIGLLSETVIKGKKKEKEENKGNAGGFGGSGVPVNPEQMQRWMSNPYVVDALNDPRTGEILAEIQKDRSKFPVYARMPKIAVLIQAGILQVPPEYK